MKYLLFLESLMDKLRDNKRDFIKQILCVTFFLSFRNKKLKKD